MKRDCELLEHTIEPVSIEGDVTKLGQSVGYHIKNFGIPKMWSQCAGEGVRVAVLDTGCDIKHKDLAKASVYNYNPVAELSGKAKSLRGKFKRYKQLARRTRSRRAKKKYLKLARRFRQKLKNYTSNVSDGDSHGTHVSGIVRAHNNAIGVVGIAPKCELMVIKVLDDNGYGTWNGIADGIRAAVNYGADVINMSLGGSRGNSSLASAIKYANRKNVPVVCAAGNDGKTKRLCYPAEYPETIAAGALTKENTRASFSQTGSRLEFMAPGVNIVSTIPKSRYGKMSGTSQASPWITGIITLMISKHKKHGGNTPVDTVQQIREHLKKISVDMGPGGHDKKTGHGLIDVSKLADGSVTEADVDAFIESLVL